MTTPFTHSTKRPNRLSVPEPLYPAAAPDAKQEQHTAAASGQQHAESGAWTLKEKIVLGCVSLAIISGGIWLGNRYFRKRQTDKEENQTLTEGSPATFAKQIKMAFDNDGWWGTNTTALRTALQQVPSRQDWQNILQSYSKLYNANLLQDMASELQSSEYNEMLQIISAKPLKKGGPSAQSKYSAWAKRLKAAFDKVYGFIPGTDEAAVLAVIAELPTQHAFVLIGVEYKRLFGASLVDAMKAEGQDDEFPRWMQRILQKPKQ